jgi:hypothetical protein
MSIMTRLKHVNFDQQQISPDAIGLGWMFQRCHSKGKDWLASQHSSETVLRRLLMADADTAEMASRSY